MLAVLIYAQIVWFPFVSLYLLVTEEGCVEIPEEACRYAGRLRVCPQFVVSCVFTRVVGAGKGLRYLFLIYPGYFFIVLP